MFVPWAFVVYKQNQVVIYMSRVASPSCLWWCMMNVNDEMMNCTTRQARIPPYHIINLGYMSRVVRPAVV